MAKDDNAKMILVANRMNGGKPGGESNLASLNLAASEVDALAAFFAGARWRTDFDEIKAEDGHVVEIGLAPSATQHRPHG